MQCCAQPLWSKVRDLGTASALEFDLGRCAACGGYLMHIYYQGTVEYQFVSEADAEAFLDADPGPARRMLIKRWLDKIAFWSS